MSGEEAEWAEAIRRTRAVEPPWVDLTDDDAYEAWLKNRGEWERKRHTLAPQFGQYQGAIRITAAELAECERQQKYARDWVKARRYIRELTALADEIQASPEYRLEARIAWSGVFDISETNRPSG